MEGMCMLLKVAPKNDILVWKETAVSLGQLIVIIHIIEENLRTVVLDSKCQALNKPRFVSLITSDKIYSFIVSKQRPQTGTQNAEPVLHVSYIKWARHDNCWWPENTPKINSQKCSYA